MPSQPDDANVVDETQSERVEHEDSQLFELLYADLKRRAFGQIRSMPLNQTLQPTDLVHEAYARLKVKGHNGWDSRSQFFAIAVRAMRDVLVDAIRRKSALKRGGQALQITLSDELGSMDADGMEALGDALTRLEKEYPDVAQLVLLRFLGGFTMEEIAEMQQVSMRTTERRWRFGRAWLQTELKET